MRAASLLVPFVLALGLAGCKTDDDRVGGPPLALVAEPLVTGSIPAIDQNFILDDGVANWYQQRGATLPLGDRLVYCHGFGCEFQTPVPMGEAEQADLTAIFTPLPATPAEERDAVNRAGQWWEKRAEAEIGVGRDHRGSEFADAHRQGQTDCLDEATNTTTLLTWLQRNGFLRFHRVERPRSRGAFFYAHATAVFRDRITGIDWVADSWMRDGGDPIDVMPLEEWFARAYIDPVS